MGMHGQTSNINIYVDGQKVGSAKNISMPIEKEMFEFYCRRKNKLFFRNYWATIVIVVADHTLYKDMKIGKKYEVKY